MTVSDLESLPKAVLHEHLDGGLRVATILEIADADGYDGLPARDVEALAEWFYQGRSGSLERYLEAFVHTTAVMQTQESITRIAYEAAEDLANDGVVYAEIRYDAGLSTKKGLTREDATEAILDGYARAKQDHGIVVYAITTALRHLSDSVEVVQAAIPFVGEGVVAFDLAGPEDGFPPDAHIEACRLARRAGLGVTLHAGEGDGVHSIWRAIALCGAQRVGHGVRIVDDTDFDGFEILHMGPFARRIRDHRIPLEIAITSNLHTSSFDSAPVHPFGALLKSGFNVTLNTDNRLMSNVTMSGEYRLAAESFDLSVSELGEITCNAIRAGFGDWPTRRALMTDVIEPAYESRVGVSPPNPRASYRSSP